MLIDFAYLMGFTAVEGEIEDASFEPVTSPYFQEGYPRPFELWVAASDQLAAARFRGGCGEGIAK